MTFKTLKIDENHQIDGAHLKYILDASRVYYNKHNRQILDVLTERPNLPVHHIMQVLKWDQSITSQRLANLRKFGFVASVRKGKLVRYCNNDDRSFAFERLMKRISIATKNESAHPKYVIRALAHKTRIDILQALINDDGMSVTEIYIKFRIEQSFASSHLKKLRDQGLVNFTQDGKEHLYRADKLVLCEIANDICAYYGIIKL